MGKLKKVYPRNAVALVISSVCLGMMTAKAEITISNLVLTKYSVSFTIDGTLPATAPDNAAAALFFINPSANADPGFVIENESGPFLPASTRSFTGSQPLYSFGGALTGATSYGDYFIVDFENNLSPGETVSGDFAATWDTPVFDPNKVSELNAFWGSNRPPDSSGVTPLPFVDYNPASPNENGVYLDTFSITVPPPITISNLVITEYGVSFSIDGTLPAISPANAPTALFFINPNATADPGFALSDESGFSIEAASRSFTGSQPLYSFGGTSTGAASLGDYFIVDFENALSSFETLSGDFTATWDVPAFDPTEVSELIVYWGSNRPLDSSGLSPLPYVNFNPASPNENGVYLTIASTTGSPTEELKVVEMTKSGDVVTVQFEGIDGTTYFLNKSLSLDFGTPNIVASIVLSGTTTGVLQDPNATETSAFYRIESP